MGKCTLLIKFYILFKNFLGNYINNSRIVKWKCIKVLEVGVKQGLVQVNQVFD